MLGFGILLFDSQTAIQQFMLKHKAVSLERTVSTRVSDDVFIVIARGSFDLIRNLLS